VIARNRPGLGAADRRRNHQPLQLR
jgi:hypothetical protein